MDGRVVAFLGEVVRWAEGEPLLTSVALVGSHARVAARADSDVDLMILSAEPERYAEDTLWLRLFGEVALCTEEDWGLVTSLRVFYAHGLEVEFSLATPAWATLLIDVGTRRVVSDGMQVLYDPNGVFEGLQRAVGASG